MAHKIDFSSIVKMQSYAKHFTTATVAHSGVTVNEFYTLTIINDYSPCTWVDLLREFSQATLAATTHSLRSRLSRVVKQLEQRGLVQRHQSQIDRRCQELSLTKVGEETLIQVEQEMAAAVGFYKATVDDVFPVNQRENRKE